MQSLISSKEDTAKIKLWLKLRDVFLETSNKLQGQWPGVHPKIVIPEEIAMEEVCVTCKKGQIGKPDRIQFSSVQFSCSVMSHSLRPHGLQHARLPCPVPTPETYSNSCPLSEWWPSNHLILFNPLLLPSIFPSIRVFLNESVFCIRWPKYWSFSFSICLSS